MPKVPKTGICPVCATAFPYIPRKQGGGKRKIYCSSKCCKTDWAQGNSRKRKASVIKYDNKPESKQKKRARSRKATLKKYNWTEKEFMFQLIRQHHSCRGCLTRIDKKTARIDHCHDTGTVRGLLCDSCNWGIGHLKDNTETLRRLMAYLDHDIHKTHIYLVGALKNKRVPEIGNKLRGLGHDVMDEWFTPGELADLNWQEYERQRGRTYTEALRGRAATNIALFDRSYLDLADIVILVMPAGKSAMLELGYAKGRGKRTIIFLDGKDPDRYDVMPGIIDQVIFSEEELLSELSKT